MNKKLIYGLIALTSLSCFSCKDDDPVQSEDDANVDRMFMPMFRRDDNTNRGSDDPYQCGLVEGTLNSLYLAWYGVKDAAAYQIVMGTSACSGPDRWADPANVLMDTIVPGDRLNMTIEHLNYNYNYAFSIRALDPRGASYNAATKTWTVDDTCPFHSKWYGRGDERHNTDYFRLWTDQRYDVPDVVTISDRTETSFRVNFDFSVAASSANEFPEFERDENGNFVAQVLSVTPSAVNPDAGIDPKWAAYPLSDEDLRNGYVDITDLTPNSAYVVDLLNTNIPYRVDQGYNMLAPRTSGQVGEPVFLSWAELKAGAADTIPEANDYQAARLDTVIKFFNRSSEHAEGTIFELEGGKNYYFATGCEVQKGFTLRTRPEDVAQGKRAMIFLGGISKDPVSGDPLCYNWQWGKVPAPGESGAPIMVGDIIFENLDFSSPLARRHDPATKKDGTGNYFGNCDRNICPVSFNSMQIKNCSIQDVIRGGFARVQGSTRKTFDMILIENCVMWNCGFYQDSGGGYNWIHGNEDANVRSNVFRNVIIRGNSFVDSPHGYLVHDKDKNNAWPSNIRWKFTVENNTFLNYCTRSSSQQMFKLRYIPGDTEFHVHNNLFIQAKDADDDRNMNLTLVDIRTVNTEPYFGITVDISDNYGCTWDPNGQKDDGTPTGGKFSDSKNSFGNMTTENGWTPGITNGVDELKIKTGSTPLLPTELMRAPNPPYHNGHAKMHQRESLDGLFYNHTDKVVNHEIYTKGIGDTRWRDANDMKSFWLLKANE